MCLAFVVNIDRRLEPLAAKRPNVRPSMTVTTVEESTFERKTAVN